MAAPRLIGRLLKPSSGPECSSSIQRRPQRKKWRLAVGVGRRGMFLDLCRVEQVGGRWSQHQQTVVAQGTILGAFHSTTLFDLGARHCDLVSFVDATLPLYTQVATATCAAQYFGGSELFPPCCCCCCCRRAAVVSCQLQQRPIGCDLNRLGRKLQSMLVAAKSTRVADRW